MALKTFNYNSEIEWSQVSTQEDEDESKIY